MAPPSFDPEKQRRFATETVRRLTEAGFEAYWAGGCVRDMLLNRVPKDYDVATGATPEQIRGLFGRRRTLAIGAAFGVISVLGPKGAGQIEVATFRTDASYSDGRHPDSVAYGTAREDASRRDFTVNGLFYDPLAGRVIDFVEGQPDLKAGILRAIGRPQERISEDKLRMLRAVRFAATLDFTIEAQTWAMLRRRAHEITIVSAERIATEMRQMLRDPRRVEAVHLLIESGLAEAILPEIVTPARHDHGGPFDLENALDVLGRLRDPGFPLALAALLDRAVDRAGGRAVARRWRLSNEETERLDWLLAHRGALDGAATTRWSSVQPLLTSPGIGDLLAWEETLAELAGGESEDLAYCRRWLARPRAELDPPPLVTGDDLIALGIPTGPIYGELLSRIRNAQLDGEIHTKPQAQALAKDLR